MSRGAEKVDDLLDAQKDTELCCSMYRVSVWSVLFMVAIVLGYQYLSRIRSVFLRLDCPYGPLLN